MILPANIPAAIERLGITDYKTRGDELTASCPSGNHTDFHPSWSINTSTGLFNCFACGFSGSFPNLVQKIQGLDYDQALSWILAMPLRKIEIPDTVPEKTKPLLSLEGFTIPPENILREKHLRPEACKKYEYLWDGENFIAPIRDSRTYQLLGWQEKSGHQKRFRNFPVDVPKSSTLFGLPTLDSTRTLVVVESPDDPVRFESAGIGNATATFGVHISKIQLEIIKRFPRVVFALDNDDDGFRETARVLRELSGAIPASVFDYNNSAGIDPGKLTDSEIIWGYENAISGLLWRWRK